MLLFMYLNFGSSNRTFSAPSEYTVCTDCTRTWPLSKKALKYGLTFATFNPLICFGQVEDVVEAKSSAGLSIWREDHPVHLTEAAYGDIAAVLSTQAETTSKHLMTGKTRPMLVSVVPAPATS